MIKRKSYTTSEEIAEELKKIAEEMGVPEASVINFALKEFFWSYRRKESEKRVHQPPKELKAA